MRSQPQRPLLETVIDNIDVGVIICDTDGKIGLINASAQRYLGARKNHMEGSIVFDLFPMPHNSEIRAAIRQIARSHPEEKSFHSMVVNIEGSAIKCSTYPIFRDSDQVMEVVLLLEDITREVEINKAKSEFTSVVAHELRTPLTSLKGAIGLILGGATGDVGERLCSLLGIAQESCDRLIRLVDDMLDVAQAESGNLPLRLKVIRLDECVVRAVDSLRHRAEDKHLSLTAHIGGRPLSVIADQDRIEQVLLNIIANAVKFSPEGGKIDVKLRRSGAFAHILVSDEGPGIPNDEREKVFEKFYRLHNNSERGAGLGLAISKAIVEQLGGRIYVRRRRQGGSTFTVELPIPGESGLLRSAD